MTPLPGAIQNTGLILATVLAAAGLNLGVMSLGQPEGDTAGVDTAATPTSADTGLQALNDTAPSAIDPSTITTVPPTDPAATDPAASGNTLPAGTGVTPGLPVSSETSSTPAAASSTAAPATAAANTGPAGTATSQPTTVTTRPSSSQAPSTLPPATVTTARPTVTVAPTTSTTARPTTTTARPTTTRAPQTSNYDHTVSGAGSLTVSVTDGARLGLVSVSDASGWSHTVDTNRADLVKVVFTRRGSEIAVSVTLRNGVPNFTEERSNDD